MRLTRGSLRRWLTIGLLWAFFAQAVLVAQETSITLDEPLHIASGYSILRTGDYRLVEEHPPFLKMLQAAPLLLADPPPAEDVQALPGWAERDLIVFAQHLVVDYRPIDPLVFAARVPTMLIGVLLGVLIFRWAADLAGQRGALPVLAVVLFAFDPNLLGHAAVAATDLGAAAGILAALYSFWRWLRDPVGPRWSRALLAAIALGIALGTKNTALILGPIYALLLVSVVARKGRVGSYLTQALFVACGAGVTLWAIYGFEFGPAAGIPFSIPAPSHLLPLRKLQEHMREGHSAFLMGQNYHHGDWRYFPVAFALKPPPLTLGLGTWAMMKLIGEVVAPGLSSERRATITGNQSSFPAPGPLDCKDSLLRRVLRVADGL
ncbi:MAG: ArnT family glycosyltransferase [Anaerolineae bacterium]